MRGGGGGAGFVGLPDNADLADLTVSQGVLVPAFGPQTVAYGVGPSPFLGDVMLTATTADGGASLVVPGYAATSGLPSVPIALGIGRTAVAVVVTAADGMTQQTYVATFDRTSPDPVGLVASAGVLDPLFASDTLDYAVGPSLLESSSTLPPTARDPGTTIRVNSWPTPSGTASAPIVLAEGLTPRRWRSRRATAHAEPVVGPRVGGLEVALLRPRRPRESEDVDVGLGSFALRPAQRPDPLRPPLGDPTWDGAGGRCSWPRRSAPIPAAVRPRRCKGRSGVRGMPPAWAAHRTCLGGLS